MQYFGNVLTRRVRDEKNTKNISKKVAEKDNGNDFK